MQYQTLDQLRQRCVDQLPGFDPVSDDALLRAWVWDALRRIDTFRLGEFAEATVNVVGGKATLPEDFLGIHGMRYAASPDYNYSGVRYHVMPGGRNLRGYPDGPVRITYFALPLDDEGYPYILDEAEMAVMAYVEWQFMALTQKKQYLLNPFGFRIDTMLNRDNEARANSMLSAVRGELNMLSDAESENLRIMRQEIWTYRNR